MSIARLKSLAFHMLAQLGQTDCNTVTNDLVIPVAYGATTAWTVTVPMWECVSGTTGSFAARQQLCIANGHVYDATATAFEYACFEKDLLTLSCENHSFYYSRPGICTDDGTDASVTSCCEYGAEGSSACSHSHDTYCQACNNLSTTDTTYGITINKSTTVCNQYDITVAPTVAEAVSNNSHDFAIGDNSFTVTVTDPCPSSTWTYTDTTQFPAYTYTLQQGVYSYSWLDSALTNTLGATCPITWTITNSDGTAINAAAFTQTAGVNTLAISTTDTSLVGTHDFVAVACLSADATVCTNTGASAITIPFTITIVDPCDSATVSLPTPFTDQTYSLGDAQTSYTLTDAASNDVGTFCGTYTYVFSSTTHGNILSTTTTDFTTSVAQPSVLPFNFLTYTQTLAMEGVHDISVEIYLTDYKARGATSYTTTQAFTQTISNPCRTSTLTLESAVNFIATSYTIGYTSQTISWDDATAVTNSVPVATLDCGTYTFTMCLTSACDSGGTQITLATTSTGFTFLDTGALATLTLLTQDPTLAGYSGATSLAWTVWVKATSDLYGASDGVTQEGSFVVTFVDPCPDAAVSIVTSTVAFADYTYQVAADKIDILETASLQNYFNMTLDFCTPWGLRIYLNDTTTANLLPTGTPVALSDTFIGSIYTEDYAHVGVHYLYMEPFLVNYPLIKIADPIIVTLTITGCSVGDLSPSWIPDFYWDRANSDEQYMVFEEYLNGAVQDTSCVDVWEYAVSVADPRNDFADRAIYDTALEDSDVAQWITFDSETREFKFKDLHEYEGDKFIIRVTGTLGGVSTSTTYVVYTEPCPSGTYAYPFQKGVKRYCIPLPGTQEPVATTGSTQFTPDGYTYQKYELTEDDYNDYLENPDNNCDLGYVGMDQFGIIRIRLKKRAKWANVNWKETVNATVLIYEKFLPLMDESLEVQKKMRELQALELTGEGESDEVADIEKRFFETACYDPDKPLLSLDLGDEKEEEEDDSCKFRFKVYQTDNYVINVEVNRTDIAEINENRVDDLEYMVLYIWGLPFLKDFASDSRCFKLPYAQLISVPELLDPNATSVNLIGALGKGIGGAAKSATVGILAYQRVLFKTFRASMNELLGMLLHFQNLVYLPLGKFDFPAISMLLYKEIIEITTFDMFPTDDWYPAWFDLPYSPPFNREFEAFKFDGTIFILNLGSLWIIFVTMILQYAILFAVRGCKNSNRFCRYINKKLQADLIWNGPIDYFNSAIIEIGFAMALNFSNFTWEGGWGIKYVSNGSLFILTVCLVVYPIWHIGFLCKNFENLGDEKFEKYESAFADIAKDKRSEIWHTIIFITRRVLVVVIFTQGAPIFIQLITLTFIQLVKILYVILYNPFEDLYHYRLELFNEICILGLTYHLYTFSDWVTEANPRFIMGMTFNILTLIQLVVNFGLLLISIVLDTIKACKEKLCKRKSKKEPNFEISKKSTQKVKTFQSQLTVINEKTNEDEDYDDEVDLVLVLGKEFTMRKQDESQNLLLSPIKKTKKSSSDDKQKSQENSELILRALIDFQEKRVEKVKEYHDKVWQKYVELLAEEGNRPILSWRKIDLKDGDLFLSDEQRQWMACVEEETMDQVRDRFKRYTKWLSYEGKWAAYAQFRTEVKMIKQIPKIYQWMVYREQYAPDVPEDIHWE